MNVAVIWQAALVNVWGVQLLLTGVTFAEQSLPPSSQAIEPGAVISTLPLAVNKNWTVYWLPAIINGGR